MARREDKEMIEESLEDYCSECERYEGLHGPSHKGSAHCKSGSIASGGTKAHCSCGSCF